MVLPGDRIYQSVGSSDVVDEERTSRGRVTTSIRKMERAADSWSGCCGELESFCCVRAFCLAFTLYIAFTWVAFFAVSPPCFQLLYHFFVISQPIWIRLLLHDIHPAHPSLQTCSLHVEI